MAILFIPLIFIVPVRVLGKKNLNRKGRVILACNHQSLLDGVIIAHKLCFRRRFRFMAKKSLFKNKLGSAFFKSIGLYPVDRGGNDIQAVKQTLRLLNNEKAVCIFPEGTRLKSDETNEIKNGTAMFALKTGSPIVPAFIIKKPKAFCFNTMILGEAFNLSEMEEFKGKKIDKELLNKASEIISQRIYACRDEYLNRKVNKKNKKQVK